MQEGFKGQNSNSFGNWCMGREPLFKQNLSISISSIPLHQFPVLKHKQKSEFKYVFCIQSIFKTLMLKYRSYQIHHPCNTPLRKVCLKTRQFQQSQECRCLTLFDMGGGASWGAKNVFDHCAQTRGRRKLKLGNF